MDTQSIHTLDGVVAAEAIKYSNTLPGSGLRLGNNIFGGQSLPYRLSAFSRPRPNSSMFMDVVLREKESNEDRYGLFLCWNKEEALRISAFIQEYYSEKVEL